ncbi:MAG: pyridoxamine 5'-phosphate oxidase family protein [Prolixibacteraceae bacterium]|jgi:nitroimidazol reductase NimA-like FMN-containing flavoprotein (pyridoxamine 5'-phosphate oxidase superfamily)|nr:pyridoxamine 5'-phosphate oxidase family protein [Prolixibacteraceae bacterium]
MRTVFIEDQAEIEKVIKACRTCFLGLSDLNMQPYVVPMNFAFEKGVIYLHSGPFGRKWEIMKENTKACITFVLGDELTYQDEHVGCSWRVKSKSVIAEGEIEFVEEFNEKEKILHRLMGQYSDREFKFNAPAVKNVGIYKMKINKLQAKEFGTKAETPWKS